MDDNDKNDKVGETDNVDRVEERAEEPQGQPTADKPDKPAQSAQVTAEEPSSGRPALKREYTPPHRIRLLTTEARRVEHVYGNVHEHITKSLNQVRSLDFPHSPISIPTSTQMTLTA